jgi:hypothetical protein
MAGIVLYGGIIPRQQPIDLALFVTVDDGRERGGQIRERIDGVEFTGLNERGGVRITGERCIDTVSVYAPAFTGTE